MKRRLVLSVLFIAVTLLSGCNFRISTSNPPVVSDQQSIEPSLDPIETELIPSDEPLLTLEELYIMFHEAEGKDDYITALSIANRIVYEYPMEQRIHWLRSQMLIKGMEFLNNEFRLGIDRYKDYPDFTDYLITFKDEYMKMDLSVEWPFLHDYTDDNQINTVGNYGTGLSSGIYLGEYGEFRRGAFCTQEDWIYYIDAKEDYSLSKMKTDMTSKTHILDEQVSNLNVIGDWIYFTNLSRNGSIYKVRTDGEMLTFISDKKCSFMVVYNDYIYYTDAESGNNLCRMRTDGTDIKNFGYNVEVINITDNHLYFRTEQHELMSMTPEGEDIKRIIADESYGDFYINSDSIYYMTIEQNGLTIFKCDKQGQNKQQLFHADYKINFYYIMDTKMLMSARFPDRTEMLVIVDLNNTDNITKLNDFVTTSIVYIKDQNRILFMNDYDNFSWMILNLADNAVK